MDTGFDALGSQICLYLSTMWYAHHKEVPHRRAIYRHEWQPDGHITRVVPGIAGQSLDDGLSNRVNGAT